MKYLVLLKQEIVPKMTPYLRKRFHGNYALVEIENEQIEWLKEKVTQIEPDFKLSMSQLYWHELGVLEHEQALVVTLGKYCLCKGIHYTYEISSRKWEEQSIYQHGATWIHAYSKKEKIDASDWLYALEQFYRLADLVKKPLIIIQNIKSELPYFQKKSLAQQIAELYLKEQPSLIINKTEELQQPSFSKKYFESASRKIVATSDSAHKLQATLKLWLEEQKSQRELVYLDEKREGLYQDIFYKQIPKEQKIYVPVYGEMGENFKLHKIAVGASRFVLYEKKSILEQYDKALVPHLYPSLEQPLLKRVVAKRTPIEMTENRLVMDEQLKYEGEGVYIGIITEEGIDYKHHALRNPDGTTRIVQYWIQENGDEGKWYSTEELNKGLSESETVGPLSWVDVENDSTALLVWAGGKKTYGTGLATKAEFLVAQIQKTPIELQCIYNGGVNHQTVLMADVLIGAHHLIEKARLAHKPLVLIIPYQTIMSTHCESGFYEGILEELGKLPGCSIVIPTGNEGNKRHHQGINRTTSKMAEHFYNEHHEKEKPSVVEIEVLKESRYMAGVLQFKNIPLKCFKQKIELSMLAHPEQSIAIDEEGIYTFGEQVIYSTGLIASQNNMESYIRWVMKKVEKGNYCIKTLPTLLYENAQIDFYLTEEKEGNIRCTPSTPFGTMGTLGALEGVISVGGYDEKNQVVLASCSKGEQQYEGKKPFCVVNGKESYLCGTGRAYGMEGSVVATGLMAGVIAMLYQKDEENGHMPYASTVRIKQILLEYLKNERDYRYPNASQGYGFLTSKTIAQLASRVD